MPSLQLPHHGLAVPSQCLQNPMRSRTQASVVGAEPQPGALQVRLQHRAHPLHAKSRLTPLSRAGDTPTCVPRQPRGGGIFCQQPPTRSCPHRKCRSLLIPRRERDCHSWPRYKTPQREGKRRQGYKAWDLTLAELSCRAPGCRLEKMRLKTMPLGQPCAAGHHGLGTVSQGGTALQGSRRTGR